jgi:polyhydroxyalkanoate synthesis regulator phasin
MSRTDPMFDRLATLVIELKERIVALEAQVADLEKKVSP